MRSRLVSTALSLVVFGAVTAAAQTWTGSSSPEDLRYRLDVLDAELADLRARIGGSAVAAPSGAGGASLAQVQQFEIKLQDLTRRIEQLEYQQRQLSENANRRFGDIEFRLTELEGGDIRNVTTPPPLIPGTAQPQPGTGAPAAGPTIAAAGGEAPAVAESERRALELGANDIQQGRFDQGEDRLQKFLRDFPGSPLSGDAHYWLAESRFVRGDLQGAARGFLDSYQSDQRGPRAPAALYRLGVTLGRLGQINEACLTLREVRNQYPGAPDDVARKADAEADSLACG